MARLISKKQSGKRLWYIVENRTMEGKSRRVYLKSLGEMTKRAADDALANYNVRQKPINNEIVMFSDVYCEFLDRFKVEVGRSITETTLKVFISMSKHFKTFFNGKINDIRYRDIELLKDACISKGLSPRSVNIVLIELKKVFKYAVRMEIIEAIPIMDPMRQTLPEIRRASTSELETIFKIADDEMRFYLIFLLYTGIRPYEFHNLKWSDIDLENFSLTIRSQNPKKKGGVIAMPLTLVSILESRDRETDCVSPFGNECITSAAKRMRRLTKQLGIQITPKTLRKTYLSILSESNVSDSILNHQGRNSAEVRRRSYLSPSHWAIAELINDAIPVFNSGPR